MNPFYLDTDSSLQDIGANYVAKSFAYILDYPELSEVKAVKNRNVHILSLHESQFIAQSVSDLARLAYPDLFTKH